MNTTTFTILTSNDEFINKLKENNVPIVRDSDVTYTSIVPVYVESKLCDFIAECAAETKANVAVHVSYQDPGTGESSGGIMHFVNGKVVS